MPLISICINTTLSPEAKRDLAQNVTSLFASEAHTAPAHVHVAILDGQYLSFGGDGDAPAASVTIKAADASINKDVRKALVAGFSKAVPQAVSTLTGDRLYMTFEDIPVQNFAVGDSIMTFDTMHTAKSSENLAEVAP
jgi:phenylpyruvate tautomerase PptA (4-oxalocrotonate tautomerase family)